MTKEELEAIGVRVEAATPGPWTSRGERIFVNGVWHASVCAWGHKDDDPRMIDAIFIAHARANVPALLAYVAELEQDRNLYKTAAESKETLYETACAGRESAQRMVANLERELKSTKADLDDFRQAHRARNV